MSKVNVKFVFSNRFTLTVDRTSFRKCIKFVRGFPNIDQLIYFKNDDQYMFFDKPIIDQYLAREISLSALFCCTKCDGLFRNIMDVQLHDGSIDAGSLWLLKRNELQHLDDDFMLSIPYPDTNFVQILLYL